MSPLWILLLLPLFGGAERFNCKGRILGAYYADFKSGCKAFHVCVRVAGGGIRDFRFYCPPGTLFHQEAQTCTDWGDDDPLACPANIYDGQFDLYKIGSGFDTKKVSSPANREEEPDFGLQRAETGDRRLAQNNAPSGPSSDLRAAHSSDFFSGQRDRGRDESANPAPTSKPAPSSTPFPRQSFRRATTPRPQPSSTQYIAPSPQPQQSNSPQYDAPKRKLVRKRPVYASTTAAPTTFVPNTPPQQPYSQPPQQPYSQPPQTYTQPPQQYTQPPQQYTQPPQQYTQPPQQYTQPPQQYTQPPQQYTQPPQQNFNRRVPTPQRETLPPQPNVPPQYKEYKDEYVEVSRVTPKQNRYLPNQNNQSPAPFYQTTPAPQFQKNEGLVEVFKYELQSTPSFNSQNDKQRPFKIRNNFSVSDISREPDFARTRSLNNNLNNVPGTFPTTDYSAVTRGPATTTVTYKNYNSVSYEPEKNNFIPYSKQNYFNSPTATPPTATTTTDYTTRRPEPPPNVNSVAYDTNIGFHSQSNYAESSEDDGQYRPPQGEDDGQYRPELYDRELLSGAHSLNIAASGNRLPEDQKPRGKTQPPPKYSQTAVPRPFRPASTTLPPPTQTSTQRPETYPTTLRPAPKTQRTFDYVKTYTTTSRPSELPEISSNAPARPSTTQAPQPSQPAPHAPSRPPHYARPPKNKEDTSYDYAYYDSDPGFSEYDQIEEFGRTKTRA